MSKRRRDMSKHTAGPWAIEKTASHNWIGPMRHDGIKIAEIVAGLERGSEYTRAFNARQDANARLIAAAPDLLEALQDLVSVAKDGWPFDRQPTLYDRARLAIRKATGE